MYEMVKKQQLKKTNPFVSKYWQYGLKSEGFQWKHEEFCSTQEQHFIQKSQTVIFYFNVIFYKNNYKKTFFLVKNKKYLCYSSIYLYQNAYYTQGMAVFDKKKDVSWKTLKIPIDYLISAILKTTHCDTLTCAAMTNQEIFLQTFNFQSFFTIKQHWAPAKYFYRQPYLNQDFFLFKTIEIIPSIWIQNNATLQKRTKLFQSSA